MSLLTITILSLSIILAVGIFFSTVTPLAFAEEVITILPGAQDHTKPRFLDITFYPIERGKELTWFNDDDVNHRIIINKTTDENNNTELVADSGIIKSEDSYTYIFEDDGTYPFFSTTHPWIKGTVFVDDDIQPLFRLIWKMILMFNYPGLHLLQKWDSRLILRLYLSTKKLKRIKSISSSILFLSSSSDLYGYRILSSASVKLFLVLQR